MTLAPDILACAVCFGNAESPLTQGANMGIFVMLGVVGVVLSGCGIFMVRLARRARQHAELEAELDQILKETKV